MEKIKASKVLFIKLGQGGQYEKGCIDNNTLRLGYREVAHQYCINQEWDKVHSYFTKECGAKPFVATSHSNQIKHFYEASEETLWITFYANKLWWCFSKPEITLHDDKSKTRPVIERWSDKDINGQLLLSGNISGKLLRTQGFQGTICSVRESQYALAKINCEQMQELVEVEQALSNLHNKLASLIQNLQWKDFETLVDLIFREAGWKRIGDLGKTQKTLDLDLFAPVTRERAMVQIKSESTYKEFTDYVEKFKPMEDYQKFFFVAHTFDKAVTNTITANDDKFSLYLVDKVAELTVSAGLTEWVIKKTS